MNMNDFKIHSGRANTFRSTEVPAANYIICLGCCYAIRAQTILYLDHTFQTYQSKFFELGFTVSRLVESL